MRCPYCKKGESRVLDSRSVEDGNEIRRRRECLLCGRRFTTYERIEEVPLWVVKKDGRRELFDREKLLRGIMKACEKRHATLDTLSMMVDEIERSLRDCPESEVSSQTIGHMVMERLRKVDKVAYVRFASVYREFKDVGEILTCLEELGVEGKSNS
ncbi:MAG TPA: transcriptional regulator NrdR [Syntrophomonadaceae bacterium]|nr:transcriptional regulator NrdR [Syntrophomonadaceae bacterium]